MNLVNQKRKKKKKKKIMTIVYFQPEITLPSSHVMNADSGIREIFLLWNPQFWALQCRIQLKEYLIAPTIGICNQVSLTKNPVSSTWNPESTAGNPESKTVLDSLTLCRSLTSHYDMPGLIKWL